MKVTVTQCVTYSMDVEVDDIGSDERMMVSAIEIAKNSGTPWSDAWTREHVTYEAYIDYSLTENNYDEDADDEADQ